MLVPASYELVALAEPPAPDTSSEVAALREARRALAVEQAELSDAQRALSRATRPRDEVRFQRQVHEAEAAVLRARLAVAEAELARVQALAAPGVPAEYVSVAAQLDEFLDVVRSTRERLRVMLQRGGDFWMREHVRAARVEVNHLRLQVQAAAGDREAATLLEELGPVAV
jgi:hypothetical protein